MPTELNTPDVDLIRKPGELYVAKVWGYTRPFPFYTVGYGAGVVARSVWCNGELALVLAVITMSGVHHSYCQIVCVGRTCYIRSNRLT